MNDVGSMPSPGQHQESASDLLGSRGISLETLCELRAQIDQECLKYTTEDHPIGNPGLSVAALLDVALSLSRPLERAFHPGSVDLFEAQLRALIATLALLRFKEVFGLASEYYVQIRRENLANLESAILLLPQHDRMSSRQNTNLYLVGLAAQYVSTFKCLRDPLRSVAQPVLAITFAGFGLVSD